MLGAIGNPIMRFTAGEISIPRGEALAALLAAAGGPRVGWTPSAIRDFYDGDIVLVLKPAEERKVSE